MVLTDSDTQQLDQVPEPPCEAPQAQSAQPAPGQAGQEIAPAQPPAEEDALAATQSDALRLERGPEEPAAQEAPENAFRQGAPVPAPQPEDDESSQRRHRRRREEQDEPAKAAPQPEEQDAEESGRRHRRQREDPTAGLDLGDFAESTDSAARRRRRTRAHISVDDL